MNHNQPYPPSIPHERVPPDLLAWARQTFDEDDFLGQVREIETTGGLALEDFIDEVESRAKGR
jgi:hypothetical protein